MTDPQGPGAGPPEPDPLPPALAAYTDYDVIRPLGRGGMGVVYLARNRLMGRLEALKLRAGPSPEEEFVREVQAAARLAHPNIVAVHSARVVLGTLVLAMEYVDGCDLGRLVARRGPLPVAPACELARQAALGLRHAHDAGVVHRDVKPSNLILSRTGGPAALKVLDFGIARADDPPPDTVSAGTPAYAAPEQLTDPDAADTRSDVYALGGTLYFLLTGNPPFPGGTASELMRQHRTEKPPPLDAVRPGVPAGLARLVERMLAKDGTVKLLDLGLARSFDSEADNLTGALGTAPAAADTPVPGTVPPAGDLTPATTVPLRVAPPAARGRWVRAGLAGGVVLAAGLYLGCALWPGPAPPGPDPAGPPAPAPAAAGPVPLFDGKTLAGWVVDGGDTGEWAVEDGAITTTGGPGRPRTWLLTERDYGDFRARFEYRLRPGGNTGFAFRAVPGERPVLSRGGPPTPNPYHHQVEITDDNSKKWVNLPTGQVHGSDNSAGLALRPVRRARPAGEWHRMEVELRGQAILVRVNGEELLADDLGKLVQAGSLYPSLARTRGRVGFQQQERRAEFRDVTIEELGPDAR